MSIVYVAGAELPELAITWLDNDGDLIDFSNGFTFELKLSKRGQSDVATITKAAGITGDSADPNLTVSWLVNELDIAPGPYDLIIKATKNGKDRYLRGVITIKGRTGE